MQREDDLCHLEKNIHLKPSLQLKTMNHTLNYKKDLLLLSVNTHEVMI